MKLLLLSRSDSIKWYLFGFKTNLVDSLEDRADHGVEVAAVTAVGLEQRGKDVHEVLARGILAPSLTHYLYYSWVNLVYNIKKQEFRYI